MLISNVVNLSKTGVRQQIINYSYLELLHTIFKQNIHMISKQKHTHVVTHKKSIYKQDFAINELPQSIKEQLYATNFRWLNSFKFCEGYPINPAERVFLTMDTEKVYDAIFYRVKKKMGLLKIVEVIGFPTFNEQDVLEIIKIHNGSIAVLNTLNSAVKPDEKWQSTDSAVYCKDYVTIVKLPNTKDEYLNQLGKNKRRQLPRYLRRLFKHFDDNIEIRYESKENIKFEDVMALEYLNRERRAQLGKGIDSMAITLNRQKQRWALTQALGLLVTIRHEGKIIGGTLNYIHNKEAIMLVTGHDSAIDNLRIGTLGIWKTMEYLIDNHCTECNFLWGRKVYKVQFLGTEYPWVVHVISRYKSLAIAWKMFMVLTDFQMRCWRFLTTRLGFTD
jgi:hypothetical protein